MEPPRHLVLFCQQSLDHVLRLAGFSDVQNVICPSPLPFITGASEAIRRGLRVEDDLALSYMQRLGVWMGRLRQAVDPRCKEFLTIVAMKR